MQRVFHTLFDEGERLNPRVAVFAGLIACVINFFKPVMGLGLSLGTMPVLILCLGLVCYAAFRLLLPRMDQRDPDNDEVVVWGGMILFVMVGVQGFGLFFAAGLTVGGILIWWRAPEFLEIFGYPEETEENQR